MAKLLRNFRKNRPTEQRTENIFVYDTMQQTVTMLTTDASNPRTRLYTGKNTSTFPKKIHTGIEIRKLKYKRLREELLSRRS